MVSSAGSAHLKPFSLLSISLSLSLILQARCSLKSRLLMRSVSGIIITLVLSALDHCSSSTALLVNTTIDDDGVDPNTGLGITYSPASLWERGQVCTTCNARPDPSVALLGTWHDSTYHIGQPVISASAQFQGSALYVYCILAPITPNTETDSYMSMFIDHELVGMFIQSPAQVTIYTSTLVYQNTSIPSGSHFFELQNGNTKSTTVGSLMLFDYLVYSHDDNETSSTTPSTPTGSMPTQPNASNAATNITGGSASGLSTRIIIPVVVVAAVLIIILLLVIAWLWRKRRRVARNDARERDILPDDTSIYYPPISQPNVERYSLLPSGKSTLPETTLEVLMPTPEHGASSFSPALARRFSETLLEDTRSEIDRPPSYYHAV